jgi:hypothetical protein
LFAQPHAVFDPVTGTFIVANQGAVFANDLFYHPILVSTFDPQTGTFADPVNTFPNIAPEPIGAHDPELAVNPDNGNLFLAFTRSDGSGQAAGFVTRSTNGGGKWKKPVSVTGPGTNDFLTTEVAPNGNLYFAWTDFGPGGSTTNDFLFSRSTDGGVTFTDPVAVATDVLKSGTSATCGGQTRQTYLGRLVTQDAPQLVVDPNDPRNVFLLYPGQGVSDDSDLYFRFSRNAGGTWSNQQVLPTGPGTQMFPDVQVTPDGRIGVTYYDARSASEVDYDLVVAILTATSVRFTSIFSVNDASFPTWNTLAPYDTAYTSCFGMQGNIIAAPGSGFFMAWADGGDPGPGGNFGVDPNIDFARFDGGYAKPPN